MQAQPCQLAATGCKLDHSLAGQLNAPRQVDRHQLVAVGQRLRSSMLLLMSTSQSATARQQG